VIKRSQKPARNSPAPPRSTNELLAHCEQSTRQWSNKSDVHPHSAELFDRNARVAGDLAQEAHAQLEKAIQAELRKAQDQGLIDLKSRGLSALAAARLFDQAAQGIVQHALQNPAAWPDQLFHLTDLMVRGLVLDN
jgi:hypothetical protein